MITAKDKTLYASLLMMLLITNPFTVMTDDSFCTKSWSNIYFNDYTGGARLTNGSFYSWGVNQFGTLGNAPAGAIQSTPSVVFGNWLQLALNLYYTIALGSDHNVYGWGTNVYGNLGNIVPLGGIKTIADAASKISAVGSCSYVATHGLQYTSYVIKTTGTLWGFGDNSHGQLGVATSSLASSVAPVQIGNANGWASVFPAKRDSHVCALKINGNLFCWGENYFGQVGDGSTIDHPVPVRIGSASDVWVAVYPQLYFTIALHNDGSLWAWGTTYYGIFANGNDYSSLPTPTRIAASLTFKAVAVHDNYLIAITTDGKLYGWGDNRYTQVNSNPGVGIQNTPNKIDNGNNWAKVFVSVGIQMNAIGSAFAIKSSGALFAWGSNDVGQLGLGSTAVVVSTPTKVRDNVASVVSIGYVTGIIDTLGEIYVTGYNNFDLLGDGTIDTSTSFHSCQDRTKKCVSHTCQTRLLRD